VAPVFVLLKKVSNGEQKRYVLRPPPARLGVSRRGPSLPFFLPSFHCFTLARLSAPPSLRSPNSVSSIPRHPNPARPIPNPTPLHAPHPTSPYDAAALSVFWTGNLLRGVPEVDERGLAEIGNSKEETRGTQFRQVRAARCVIPYVLYAA
jgi:hypothetical protein